MTFINRIVDADQLREEISRHRPLKGQALKQLRDYFRIGLTWASNALEGNSLTETETKVVIEDGLTIGGKPLIPAPLLAAYRERYRRTLALKA